MSFPQINVGSARAVIIFLLFGIEVCIPILHTRGFSSEVLGQTKSACWYTSPHSGKRRRLVAGRSVSESFKPQN